MQKIIALVVGIFYLFGTSTLFHVFTMGHVHATHYDMSSHHDGHTNHHHKNDITLFSPSVCGGNVDCDAVCGLVEGSKISVVGPSIQILHLGYCKYHILSSYWLEEKNFSYNKWFEDLTIHTPQFSIILLGTNKLTI